MLAELGLTEVVPVTGLAKQHEELFLPNRPDSILLPPGSQTTTFKGKISINRLGFRGPEIDLEKGEAYRIVALGESTTFGHTLRADDVPWPELLQQLIVQRLKPDRPVQVINAGNGLTVETHNHISLARPALCAGLSSSMDTTKMPLSTGK